LSKKADGGRTQTKGIHYLLLLYIYYSLPIAISLVGTLVHFLQTDRDHHAARSMTRAQEQLLTGPCKFGGDMPRSTTQWAPR